MVRALVGAADDGVVDQHHALALAPWTAMGFSLMRTLLSRWSWLPAE